MIMDFFAQFARSDDAIEATVNQRRRGSDFDCYREPMHLRFCTAIAM